MRIIIILLASINLFADNLTARVIFAETGPISCATERLWVASTIKNRIGHIGFNQGRHKTMNDVVTQKGQFESLGHNANSTWLRSAKPKNLKGADLPAWNQSVLLATHNFTSVDSRVVYFHDNSISKPKSWDNRYWQSYVIKKTKNFTFYGVKKR